MRACSLIAECSLAYAKITYPTYIRKNMNQKMNRFHSDSPSSKSYCLHENRTKDNLPDSQNHTMQTAVTRESLKKAEKGSGVYTMGSVYKLPDTWTPTFDLSNHEKVSARNDYAEKPLKKVVEEIVERKNGDRMQRNMPYFVRLVVDYFYDRMRKTKNLQYGDRTQNHGPFGNRVFIRVYEYDD